MSQALSLPIFMPDMPGQRWSCHSCGDCCRSLVGHLFEHERANIVEQGWAKELGVEPCVRVGRGWVLNKRRDGACVFLDERNLCRIHAKFGASAKPLACRIFPFSLRPVRGGWQASLRFDCPSVTSSKGEPLHAHLGLLRELAGRLFNESAHHEEPVRLQRGLPATENEVTALNDRLVRWISHNETGLAQRLFAAARLTAMLSQAKLENVRDGRFTELLDLLWGGLSAEAGSPISPASGRQKGLLRQFAYACSEHVSLDERRAYWPRRLKKRAVQLMKARRYLHGKGMIPVAESSLGNATFESAEAVGPTNSDAGEAVESLIVRYIVARIRGKSIFGDGYYGWPVVAGLGAMMLSIAAIGWWARVFAAARRRSRLEYDDVAKAVRLVDRGATRLPALGAVSERTRLKYLWMDDGLARLLWTYRLTETDCAAREA